MEVEKVVEIALKAGEILLSNGAETYRVEETIERICNAYGVTCESVSLGTGIFVAANKGNDKMVSSIKRIKQRRVDLYRIERINAFSRGLSEKSLPYPEAMESLKTVEHAPNFSFRIRVVAACVSSFVYTLMFNGTIADAVVSLIVGGMTYMLSEKIAEVGFFQFFQFFVSGFVIGCTSVLAERLLPGVDKNNVITGAIMILLPGVALTNAIKDVLYGDYASGISRFGEAVLILAAIGSGIGAALATGIRFG